MKKFTILLLVLKFLILNTEAWSQNRGNETDPQRQILLNMSDSLNQLHLIHKERLNQLAREQGISLREEFEYGVIEIVEVNESGFFQAETTNNLNAAHTSSTSHLWTGGPSGLNLMGNGYLLGIWDGGAARTAHQEFNHGGFGARVAVMDGAGLSNHATHVAGTMVAGGVQTAAHGMAPQATLRSYDWTNDISEMTSEAAGGLTISNHSYGRIRGWYRNPNTLEWFWYGDITVSTTEDYFFGFYDDLPQSWDHVAHNAPHYLIVKSVGNDRNDNHTGGHWVQSGGNWVWSNASRDPDGGADGYDCIPQRGVAKNILTVGAVQDIPAGYTSPSDVVMTAFSSWGPTDDGRIKPDIVANGDWLYSTSSAGNASYTNMSGTSMSAPTVSGSLALIQEYYSNLRGGRMSAAALKGLVINTAHEAGPNPGPDYMHGWGLLNSLGAAVLIQEDNEQGGLIVEGILNGGQTINYTYYSDGSITKSK
jgi:subtilisin family serine protease